MQLQAEHLLDHLDDVTAEANQEGLVALSVNEAHAVELIELRLVGEARSRRGNGRGSRQRHRRRGRDNRSGSGRGHDRSRNGLLNLKIDPDAVAEGLTSGVAEAPVAHVLAALGGSLHLDNNVNRRAGLDGGDLARNTAHLVAGLEAKSAAGGPSGGAIVANAPNLGEGNVGEEDGAVRDGHVANEAARGSRASGGGSGSSRGGSRSLLRLALVAATLSPEGAARAVALTTR